MTHTQKRIIAVLERQWEWDYGNCWKSFALLAGKINRSIAETRAAVHSLRDMGILHHTWMCDEEMTPCGSGYFFTRDWMRERRL